MKFFFILFFLMILASPSFAQSLSLEEGKEGEITRQPICSWLTNRSEQTIIGTLATASQTLPSGESVQHTDNFRLKAGERKQFCAAGPFHEGRRLTLTLRTLLPLFECKTKIDQEIFLDAKDDGSGFKKLSATCY